MTINVIVGADTEGGDVINGLPPIERMAEGAVAAVNANPGMQIELPGDEKILNNLLSKYGYAGKGIKTVPKNAKYDTVFEMLLRQLCAGEIHAVYTGVNAMKATPLMRHILGMIVDDLKRPPFISKMPCYNITTKDGIIGEDIDFNQIQNLQFGYYHALDLGANVQCTARNLYEFAIMAKVYVASITGNSDPRIALLNIGEQSDKGNPVDVEAYRLLKENPEINFIGNIEKPILRGDLVDIVVADGRIGNRYLKDTEAVAKFIKLSMKWLIRHQDWLTQLRCSGVPMATAKLSEMTDENSYGGAPVLGIDGAVVKTHGSFKALAAKNGLLLTHKYACADTVQTMKSYLVPC